MIMTIKECCCKVEPKSEQIFNFVDNLSRKYGFKFEFGETEYVNTGKIIFKCYVDADTNCECYIRLIYNIEYDQISPSLQFCEGSTGRRFGFELFKHYNYENLECMFECVEEYLKNPYRCIKQIIDSIYKF